MTAAVLLVHGEEDRLVPPRFTAQARRGPARRAAPSGTWPAPATATTTTSPAATAKMAYARRWEEFFKNYLPAIGRTLPMRLFLGSSVLPFNWPHAAEASGPLLRRTVTVMPASASGRDEARRSRVSSGTLPARAGRPGPRSRE